MHTIAQIDTNLCLVFDFNEHELREKENRSIVKGVGVTMTSDRFGNDNAAVYIQGHNASYLNLGTSDLLKPPHGTISLWVKLDRRVYTGKGYDSNPIFITKNGPGDDFIDAYSIAYESYSGFFGTATTKDSTEEAIIFSREKIRFGQWYHLVVTNNEREYAFYVNGILQNKVPKNFETTFLKTDSVVLGHTASVKNERFAQGVFDDIRIYHRVLSANEVKELYNEPDPNSRHRIIQEIVRYSFVALFFGIVIAIIIVRNKRMLKKQKEQFELYQHIHDLEMKVFRAQMNPHFVSNCIAAIQDMIYQNQIDTAAQYLAKFSFFLRTILNYSDRVFISLKEELEMMRLNVELEQLRFKNKFDFELVVQPGINTDDINIPSLITQPFIENAVWHGLLPLNNVRLPHLKVSVYQQGPDLCIEITDNGVGRTTSGLHPKASSHGTRLVNDKLNTLNKTDREANYRFEIIDLKGTHGEPAGTKVIIRFTYHD
ncbi:MAG: histidine kinase [Bacteroidetes bacterium]|nr:histidine kinase [Bacteroidota bacterium]